MEPTIHRSGAVDSLAFEAKTYGRVTRRLIPFLFLCYIVAYLDRVNVGFAKLQMLEDLRFSDAVYGFGAGIFFAGYFLFEVPSNIVLHRVGARIWIARIMITWGIISACMMFVRSARAFYLLRFLLGVAEAGFFPGIILYLTYWFPSERRARAVALFMSAVALSGVVGGPLSGWIMQELDGSLGWGGWQWLFLLEGIPSVLVGISVLFYLDDSIAHARWLSEREKKLLEVKLSADVRTEQAVEIRSIFSDRRVWLMSAVYFCLVMGLYGVTFWLPQIIENMGHQDIFVVGLLTAVPYGLATVAMILSSRHSDRTGERRWHLALSAFVGGGGLVLTALAGTHATLALTALSLATMGIMSALPVFWPIPTAFLGGGAAAAGIAMVNSLGNVAGFASPFMVGAVMEATGSLETGLLLLALSLALAGILVLVGTRRAQG